MKVFDLVTVLVLLHVLLPLGASPALATGYYVSRSGNDENPGTSPAEAWKTIDVLQQLSQDEPFFRAA
ncbi:MAG: hypothetical protein ACC628_21760 [Pirellulaceae bacterium]